MRTASRRAHASPSAPQDARLKRISIGQSIGWAKKSKAFRQQR